MPSMLRSCDTQKLPSHLSCNSAPCLGHRMRPSSLQSKLLSPPTSFHAVALPCLQSCQLVEARQSRLRYLLSLRKGQVLLLSSLCRFEVWLSVILPILNGTTYLQSIIKGQQSWPSSYRSRPTLP